jgi:hypothetical protein
VPLGTKRFEDRSLVDERERFSSLLDSDRFCPMAIAKRPNDAGFSFFSSLHPGHPAAVLQQQLEAALGFTGHHRNAHILACVDIHGVAGTVMAVDDGQHGGSA